MGRLTAPMLRASAPGKVMLAGEYAVLDGGSGLAAAVDYRAQVSLQPLAGDVSEWQVNGETVGRFRSSVADGLQWEQRPAAHAALLDAAFAAAGAADMPLLAYGSCRLSVDTRALQVAVVPGEESKIGVGSSAAAAVALAAVLQAAANREPDEAFAQAVHRELQQQQGSGMDVTTSFHGGLVVRAPDGTVSQPGWPTGLHHQLVWTGVSAATPPLLERFAAFRREGQGYGRHIARLRATAADVCRTWCEESVPAVLAAMATFAAALEHFDQAGRIGIWTAPHQHLAQLATRCRVVYKPSGAGGGDLGIAFAADADAIATFHQQAAAAGFMPLAPALGVPGLKLQRD